ncbi:Uncharacterised protein r2_g3477 [Pycnogonum litorale]
MNISVAKTKTLLFSRRPEQCTLHFSRTPLKRVEKFKYLGVVFTSDGRRDIELDTRIAAAGAVMRHAVAAEAGTWCKSQARRFQISLCSYPHLWSTLYHESGHSIDVNQVWRP